VEKMKLSDRAKIFLPFDALKGFREALKEQEKIKVKKISLSKEVQDEINNTLSIIRKGMMVEIKYYSFEDEDYLLTKGIVTKIDYTYKTITIVKNEIDCNNIYSIKIVNSESVIS